MKQFYIVQLIFALLLYLPACQGRLPLVESPFLSEFKGKFEGRVTAFFQQNPRLVSAYTLPESPTGFQFGISEYRLIRLSFSVSDNTQTSPGTTYGYIDVDSHHNNLLFGECGDFLIPNTTSRSFSTESFALASSKNPECFKSTYLSPSGILSKIRFAYRLANNRWEFQDVVSRELNLEIQPIAYVLGKTQPEHVPVNLPESQEINKKWLAALLDKAP